MRISSVSLEGTRRKLLPVIAVGAVVACVLPATSVAAPTPAVSAPTKQLTARWWQTMVSVPASEASSSCDLGTRNVVFLGATGTGTVSGSCTLDAGTSVLLPLINVECSSLEPEPFFGRTPPERAACAKGFADDFTDLSLIINGVSVGNLSRLRVASPPFRFSPVEGNTFGIPAGTGGSSSDGYWALIGPLAPGDYEIFASGAVPNVFATSITYHLHVV
jgi:hypothetical protein